jgi:hypothetical protein
MVHPVAFIAKIVSRRDRFDAVTADLASFEPRFGKWEVVFVFDTVV